MRQGEDDVEAAPSPVIGQKVTHIAELKALLEQRGDTAMIKKLQALWARPRAVRNISLDSSFFSHYFPSRLSRSSMSLPRFLREGQKNAMCWQ